MEDGGVTSDAEFAELLDTLLQELGDARRVLYVHCYGGHGRTGVACCSLLCLLYPWLGSLPDALKDEWACAPVRKHIMPRDILESLRVRFSEDVAQLTEGAIAVLNRFHAAREEEHGGGCIRFP